MASTSGASSYKRRILSALTDIGIEQTSASDLLFSKKVFAPSLRLESASHLLNYDPTTDELTYSPNAQGIGSISVDNSSNTLYYPLFTRNAAQFDGQVYQRNSNIPFTFTNGILSTLIFSGSLNGPLSVQNSTTNAEFYPTFVASASSGYQQIYFDSTSPALTFNPSTCTLTADTFSGTASKISVINHTGNNQNHHIPFVKGTGSRQVEIDTNFLFNPVTKICELDGIHLNYAFYRLNADVSRTSFNTSTQFGFPTSFAVPANSMYKIHYSCGYSLAATTNAFAVVFSPQFGALTINLRTMGYKGGGSPETPQIREMTLSTNRTYGTSDTRTTFNFEITGLVRNTTANPINFNFNLSSTSATGNVLNILLDSFAVWQRIGSDTLTSSSTSFIAV